VIDTPAATAGILVKTVNKAANTIALNGANRLRLIMSSSFLDYLSIVSTPEQLENPTYRKINRVKLIERATFMLRV
jgi:hypothetical protein